MSRQYTIHLESVQEGNRAPERTIKTEIKPQTDIVALFPHVCELLQIPVDSLDDYGLCVRQENVFVSQRLDQLCKST